MPTIRINIGNNANQNQSSIVLIQQDSDILPQIRTAAKNKLKLKKPARFFVSKPKSDTYFQVASEADFKATLETDATILVSCGEDYVGSKTLVSLHSGEGDGAFKQAEIVLFHHNVHVDDFAIRQLNATARLKGMLLCAGMPDLHAGGNQYPVGASFMVDGFVYPALIGGDIGCGMALYRLPMKARDVEGREEKIAARLVGIEGTWQGDSGKWLQGFGLESTAFDDSLGTVGRGNHFAEIQVVHQILDEELFQQAGFHQDSAYLLVHSGSRGFGANVLEEYVEKFKYEGLAHDSPELEDYISNHDKACTWARANRELIAHRVVSTLGIDEGEKLLDIWHNNVEVISNVDGTKHYLHRKGAAPSVPGKLVPIPGSRGTFTYLVMPVGDQQRNAHSVAHGAGRLLTRTKALSKHRDRLQDSKKSYTQNEFGGVVICEDLDLLCEEAPDAYKDIGEVVADLEHFGVVKLVATLKPLITYKMRREI